MSRQFDSDEVEELIKQAFRLAPADYFLKNEEYPTDIESAINFVRNVADSKDDKAPEPSAHYSLMLSSITAALIARDSYFIPSECIESAMTALAKKGIKP